MRPFGGGITPLIAMVEAHLVYIPPYKTTGLVLRRFWFDAWKQLKQTLKTSLLNGDKLLYVGLCMSQAYWNAYVCLNTDEIVYVCICKWTWWYTHQIYACLECICVYVVYMYLYMYHVYVYCGQSQSHGTCIYLLHSSYMPTATPIIIQKMKSCESPKIVWNK